MAGTEVIGRSAVFLELDGRLESSFGRLMSQLQEVENELNRATDDGEAFGTNLVEAVEVVGEKLSDMGAAFSSWGAGIRAEMRGVIDTFMEAGTQFEALESRFTFEFGAASEDSWQRVLDIASRTSLSTAEVVDQTIMLQRSGVDSLSGLVRTRTGEMIPALEALSDLAATKGERGGFLMQRLMQQFFTGTSDQALSHLRVLFDLPEAQMEVYREAMASADTAQERFDVFSQVTASLFGGAGRAMGNTWNFQMAQLEDQWAIFRYEVIGGFLDAMSPVLGFFTETLTMARELEDETGVFSNAFTTLGQSIAWVVDNVLNPLRDTALWLLETFPGIIPGLILFAGGMSLVASAIGAVLTGLGWLLPAAVSFSMMMANAAAVSAGLTAFLSTIGATLSTVVLPLLAQFGAVVLGIAAVGGVIYAAWESDFAGIRTIFERVTLAVRGVWEVLSTTFRGEGEMSTELAEELQGSGLFQWVIDVSGALYRFGVFAEGLWEGLRAGFTQAWRVIEPILGSMFGGVSSFFGDALETQLNQGLDVFQALANVINDMSPEDWSAVGKALGEMLAEGITAGSQLFQTIAMVHAAIEGISAVVERVTLHWDAFASVLDRVLSIFSAIGMVMSPSLMSLVGMVSAPNQAGAAPGVSNPGPVGAPTLTDSLRSGMHAIAGAVAPSVAPAVQSTTSDASRRATAILVDGRRLGEAVLGAADRERARVGLHPF